MISSKEEVSFCTFEFPHEIIIVDSREKLDHEVIQILEEYQEKIKIIIEGYIKKRIFIK